MDDELEFPAPLPPDAVETVRALYAPPGGNAYWSVLEGRIMARVTSAQRVWWQVLDGWVRPGLAAAVLLITVIGLLLLRAHDVEVRTAYDAATQPIPAESLTVPSGALSERDGPAQRGATFQDVISH